MDQSYMEILFEEMRGKFDLVLEGYATLRAEIQKFRRESNEKHDLTAFKIQVLSDEVSNLRDKVGSLDNRIGTLEGRFDTLEGKVDAVAVELAAHRSDTEVHRGYLARE